MLCDVRGVMCYCVLSYGVVWCCVVLRVGVMYVWCVDVVRVLCDVRRALSWGRVCIWVLPCVYVCCVLLCVVVCCCVLVCVGMCWCDVV